jgi:hypothetical protein
VAGGRGIPHGAETACRLRFVAGRAALAVPRRGDGAQLAGGPGLQQIITSDVRHGKTGQRDEIPWTPPPSSPPCWPSTATGSTGAAAATWPTARSATAGAASERFALAVGGEAVAEEGFTLAQTDTGQSLTGTVQLRQQGGLVDMTYGQGFAAGGGAAEPRMGGVYTATAEPRLDTGINSGIVGWGWG